MEELVLSALTLSLALVFSSHKLPVAVDSQLITGQIKRTKTMSTLRRLRARPPLIFSNEFVKA
ncbi:hypothetical protein AKJ16_DCAP15784 [Drosera capensis]